MEPVFDKTEHPRDKDGRFALKEGSLRWRLKEKSSEILRLIDDRNNWKQRAESQLDTIQGDRKQIQKLKEEIAQLERDVLSSLAHEQRERNMREAADEQLLVISKLLDVPQVPAEGQSIDDWESDVRDKYNEVLARETKQYRDSAYFLERDLKRERSLRKAIEIGGYFFIALAAAISCWVTRVGTLAEVRNNPELSAGPRQGRAQ